MRPGDAIEGMGAVAGRLSLRRMEGRAARRRRRLGSVRRSRKGSWHE